MTVSLWWDNADILSLQIKILKFMKTSDAACGRKELNREDFVKTWEAEVFYILKMEEYINKYIKIHIKSRKMLSLDILIRVHTKKLISVIY